MDDIAKAPTSVISSVCFHNGKVSIAGRYLEEGVKREVRIFDKTGWISQKIALDAVLSAW